MDRFSRFQKGAGLGQIIDNSFRSFPDREAIVFGNWRLRYSELESLIYKTARFLMGLGVKKGDSVAIISRNCPEFIIAEIAILKLGAVVVKFNWRLTPEEMAELLERSKVTCAFYKTENPLWGKELESRTAGRVHFVHLEPYQGRSVLYTLLDGFSDAPVQTWVKSDAPAYHMHTSGTTGKCKCVVYTTQRYLNQLESMLKTLEFPEGQIYQFISQLFHSACAGAFLTLATGWDTGINAAVQCKRIRGKSCAGKSQRHWRYTPHSSKYFGRHRRQRIRLFKPSRNKLLHLPYIP